jgi:hypothetical protein
MSDDEPREFIAEQDMILARPGASLGISCRMAEGALAGL